MKLFSTALFVVVYRLLHICMTLQTLNSLPQILKPSEKKAKYQYSGLNSGRPTTTKAATNKT